ncbi:MAG: PEGA domain-containing protein, partial [Verrucomicrobiota bacterium]|nr:PEGA domain-containing protein [Verrucomicrobiota bacterium]
ETLPLNYTYPHGTITVTSAPDGAEIFLNTTSLGRTPLTVDLPTGKQPLVALFPDRGEKTQSVIVEDGQTTTIAFERKSRATSSSRRRPTPPPSLMDKVGQSLKHVFSSGSKPPQRRKH